MADAEEGRRVTGDAGRSLAAFISRRLAEDRECVRLCQAEVGSTRAGEEWPDGSDVADRSDYPSYPWGLGPAEQAFMARYDPRAVLSELHRKMQLVSMYRDAAARRDYYENADEPVFSVIAATEEEMMYRVLRVLSWEWGSHPEYDREAWR